MKKALFLFGVLLAAHNISNAQCEPVATLNENFDSFSEIQSGETLSQNCWTASQAYPYFAISGETDKMVEVYSFFAGTASLYLVSPEITEFNGQTLTFTASKSATGSATIEIGTIATIDGYDSFVSAGDAITLTTAATEYSVVISALDTQKFIAFKYNASENHVAATIDNVVLEAGASVAITEKNQFKIFPNPATSILNIESNSQINSVDIFDMTGRKVAVSAIANIDVTFLNSGTYILNITTEQGISQNKFIKK